MNIYDLKLGHLYYDEFNSLCQIKKIDLNNKLVKVKFIVRNPYSKDILKAKKQKINFRNYEGDQNFFKYMKRN